MAADPDFAKFIVEQIEEAGSITHKAMFGGFGIWESGDMFGLISADSTLYFKVDDTTRPRYQDAGSEQFRTMPYWSVPADLLEDRDQLLDWANDAIAVGHRTARKKA